MIRRPLAQWNGQAPTTPFRAPLSSCATPIPRRSSSQENRRSHPQGTPASVARQQGFNASLRRLPNNNNPTLEAIGSIGSTYLDWPFPRYRICLIANTYDSAMLRCQSSHYRSLNHALCRRFKPRKPRQALAPWGRQGFKQGLQREDSTTR